MESDRFVPSLMFIVSTIFIAYCFKYRIGSISDPGVSFFPLVCALALAPLSLIQLWKSFSTDTENPKNNSKSESSPIRISKAYFIIGVMIIFCLLHSILGFWICVCGAAIALLRIGGVAWKWCILGAILVMSVGFIFFEHWMGAYFPKGLAENAIRYYKN